MGIDFSKFSQEIQAKIKAALEDAKSPDKIDAAEFRAMQLSKDVANKLMQELAGNMEFLGDGYFKAQNNNKTLVLLDKPENNTFIPITKDSLDYYQKLYDNDKITQGIYNDGVLYLADAKGKPVKDKFNNYITEKISFQEITNGTENVNGNFEIIENEPEERTNRRFAIALIHSMYNEVIQELQTILSQMGVMDVGFWRETLGMGIQALADLKENQQLFTTSTKKKIERIEAERDNICNSLNDLIDSPAEFESKFYQLVGKDYRDNAFDELRNIQHNQEDKGTKTKFKECVAKFKELYPENNISWNIENWEDSVEYQKMVDTYADIVIMLYLTGGIGKLLSGSVNVIAKNILLAAAKGNKKAVMANFAKLAPEVQTIWKSLAKKEFGVAAAQITTPVIQSSATMGSWEGIKTFLNSLTNSEEITSKELLNRTLESILGGVEMGAVMGGLEVTAIGPIMAKLTPFLNKLSGASGKISSMMSEGNGVVSMEKVMETFSKTSESLRGKIVKEVAHGIIALPVLTTGFTGVDTAFHYDEEEFRKSLLDAAVTDEEREAINKMDSIDLRLEFAKTDFMNQVKGMATIEGVGLMFRRLQAGRIAAKSLNRHQQDIIGANLRSVRENGKTYFEICTNEGETLSVKNGDKTLTRFSSIEEATSAYSVLCIEVYQQLTEIISDKKEPTTENAQRSGVEESTDRAQGNEQQGQNIDISVTRAEETGTDNDSYDFIITKDNKLFVREDNESSSEQVSKPSIAPFNIKQFKHIYDLKINGKPYKLVTEKEMSIEEINNFFYIKINTTKDARQFKNQKLKDIGDKVYNNLLRARMLDIDCMLESMEAGPRINKLIDELTPENVNDKIDEIELYLQTVFELTGKSVNYTEYKENENTKDNFIRKLSPLAKISRYFRNYKGKKLGEVQQAAKSGTVTTEIMQGEAAFSTDVDFIKQWHSAVLYMGRYANNPNSENLYKVYISRQLKNYPDIAKEVTEINKNFGVKIIIPVKFNIKQVNSTLKYIKDELLKWQKAGGEKVKYPPVLLFNSASNSKFQIPDGDFLSGGSTDHNHGSFLCFPTMDIKTIKHALRHELTHANDLQKNRHSNEAEIFTVNANTYQEADLSTLRFAKELKEMGLSDHLIRYAHTKKAELIAVAGQGNLSKCSPEFKQYLIDNGMPEFMFDLEKYDKPLTKYDKIGNKIFEISPKYAEKHPAKIAKIKAEIETLRETEPEKAAELDIILEMFTNPTKAEDVSEAQIDAVVNYLNSHYGNVEKYLTRESHGIGIANEQLGRFGHRIKGEWSTRDKIVNYLNNAIEKGKNKTLLDAYNDVRDKYASRTVFDKGNYLNNPEIQTILKEGNYTPEAYRKAVLRAAELQSQPAVEMLKEAMRRAVRDGKDLSMMRISNYTSEGGIPIFSEAQLAELKDCGKDLDIDVTFIRLASEEDPNTTQMIVEGATTKAQPSGYTALQVNFVTKAGEIIEWQYRGELVNIFAEAEHLPYDIRTGKHPWNQYPELKALYKPIADLLGEKAMPKYAYDQLNRYFTDYYNHLRKLELGFESKEPKLKDYENWTVTDKKGVETKYSFKFDKRLSAENLIKLHDYGEGIKDGTITPERALKEYNAEVGHTEEAKSEPETSSPIQYAKELSKDEKIRLMKNTFGLSDKDISRINLNNPEISNAIEFILTIKEHNPKQLDGLTSNILVTGLNHPEKIFDKSAPFLKFLTRENLDKLSEVTVLPEFAISTYEDINIPELYRVAKDYFEITGEKLAIEQIIYNNHNFKGKDGKFPTREQTEVAIKMKNAGLWVETAMWGHAMVVQSPEKITDEFIETIAELKKAAGYQGHNLEIEYNLNDKRIEHIKELKSYYDKSPIDFTKIGRLLGHNRIEIDTVLFYLEIQKRGLNLTHEILSAVISEINPPFSNAYFAEIRKDMALFFADNNILAENTDICCQALSVVDRFNINLAKELFLDKDFPKENIPNILENLHKGNLTFNTPYEEAERIKQNKVKFARRLCCDKSLNCSPETAAKLILHYYDGCEHLVINGLKTGLLKKYPKLVQYSADCWDNLIKRDYLYDRSIEQISRKSGARMDEYYARAKDDKILDKHKQLISDALANKDLLKSGVEDITNWQITSVTERPEAVSTIDLIGLGNTEAGFPLMLEEFREFMHEMSKLSKEQLSDSNKELLLRKVNPQNSLKAKWLNEEITGLKKKINEAVGKENLVKIREIQTQKAAVDASVSDSKTQLENERTAIPQYKEIAKKMENLNQKSPEYKEYEKQLADIENNSPVITNLINSIKELQKQSKALNGQAQSIYYSCENAAEVKELMKQLGPKQKELKEFLAQNAGLEPQDVVTKMRVLAGLAEISTEEEIADFICLIKPSTPENDAAWNEAVNRKIYQKLGVEYDEALSKKLDLINCKYISKLFISSDDFYENMGTLVDIIKTNPELTIEEAIDQLHQNIETKRILEGLGFDYEKFTKVDKNSYTTVQVKLSAEEAKQASIHNLEEDLNDALFKSLPKNVTEPIFKALKEQLGVTFEKSYKDNWEGDGFSAGTTEYYRLFKDGKPIVFEDMDKIVSLIKKEINKNDFWTTKHNNEELEKAKGTMYTHLMKMRTQEVDNALMIKDGETADIEVRKTDMYDIKKAIGLGNDAQCCTALGRNFNEWSAPNYIMNKCIGAIELTDKGNFVGNTMIYLAYVDGEPALILDNIELKTKYQNNDKIRDTFMDYAKKLCAEIGKPDLPIYAGPNRHKLNMDIYPKEKHTMEIIGNSGEQEVYVDYDAGGHVIGEGETAEIEMYRIR